MPQPFRPRAGHRGLSVTRSARCAWVLLPWLALGCGPRLDERHEDGLRHLTGVVKANGKGSARVKVEILPGETAMLITSVAESGLKTHVRTLTDSSGAEVFNAFELAELGRSKTNGGFVANVATLNWPVDGQDPELSEGRWVIELGLVDEKRQWTRGELGIDILLKEDRDFSRGTLHASIVLAGGLAEDPELVGATQEAAEHWASLYEQIGVHLTWELFDYDDGDLGLPVYGTEPAFEDIATLTPLRSVNIVIAPQITELRDVYGIAGDIPGPLVSTTRSGVLLSALLAAGPDGRFSSEELRLFGETMAHEAGHYLGLFHPVEANYDSWDALPDTPECDTEASCIDALSRNLMFPFPVCSFTSCIPQTELTSDQGDAVHRHVAVE